MCHEHERKLVMLYQRWELASRSRLAGAGFKLPSAAAHRNGVVVNDCGKGILSGCQVSIEKMSESKPFDDASLPNQSAVKTGVWRLFQDEPRGNLLIVLATVGV